MTEGQTNLLHYYASRSYWLESSMDNLSPRSRLTDEINVDVAILGAGYTGLWTAYYLLKQNSSLKIVIMDKHIVGFGASGRNAGWCSPKFSITPERAIERFGLETAKELQLTMYDAVNEVERVINHEKMDADWNKAGFLKVALRENMLSQLETEMSTFRKLGLEEFYQLLNENQTKERMMANNLKGGILTKVSAVLHPGKLVRNLARILEQRGVTLYEQTEVIDFMEGTSNAFLIS
ncbi:FAD-binding oxidoreductase [Neobacillus niacini]|uniref:NAD(P)/FAD-dependent oxidoreductase n=1 Tax=Neobacillus niacini TaxID=86668 RepID=UPI0021CB2C3C|nr:FAD-dependent oxidoreductase [Neobacillus niacini]